MACRVIEKAPEITACDAMMAASVASTSAGQISRSGKRRKNGFSSADGSRISSAPWPR
jgi:hypothetical protein